MTADVVGQVLGLVALALCVVAFSSKNDDRLLAILITENVAFAAHFAAFGSWAATALTGLIVVRIVLARRYKGSVAATLCLLAASLGVATLTWQGALDLIPLTAAILGTVAMFMLRGIRMRLMLAAAAFAWTVYNTVIGSVGGMLAELLVLAANLTTIVRLRRHAAEVPTAARQEG